jgi:hypothetical protein
MQSYREMSLPVEQRTVCSSYLLKSFDSLHNSQRLEVLQLLVNAINQFSMDDLKNFFDGTGPFRTIDEMNIVRSCPKLMSAIMELEFKSDWESWLPELFGKKPSDEKLLPLSKESHETAATIFNARKKMK